MDDQLLQKYNLPAPRYTSYPTVPFWEQNSFKPEMWPDLVKESFDITNHPEGIGIYIHLPFCESLCTYCGCFKRVTVNHAVEVPYLDSVLKEWQLYLKTFKDVPVIREIHLGGGTPTFFSARNLETLIRGILKTARVHPKAEFAVEGHPANTTLEKLVTLYDLGFRRLSLGIQDFDPVVQKAIHRIQSFESVQQVVEDARQIGFTSINFDLIYGLPKQRLQGMQETIQQVIQLKPDRIAFYSYAHVPWVAKGQRGFSEVDLPGPEKKRMLYNHGWEQFEGAGYREIGMDHFALEEDELCQAIDQKKLHRNFMGYTTSNTTLCIGLGVSSISDSWLAYAQNTKSLEEYTDRLSRDEFPLEKGHVLTSEDLFLRQQILNLMCNSETTWIGERDQPEALQTGLQRMVEMINDGLVESRPFRLKVTNKGKPFIRNICMSLDARLWREKPEQMLFSKSI